MFVSRSVWSARDPKNNPTPINNADVTHITVIQTGTKATAKPADVQAVEMDMGGLNDIAYSFLINNKGDIIEGRGYGTLVEDYPTSLVVGVIGSGKLNPASAAALDFLVGEMEARLGRPLILDSVFA